MAQNQVTTHLELMGDDFAHAWYFNRFRCDEMGSSTLVTMALVPKLGGTPEVNGFVIGNTDMEAARERSLKYLSDLSGMMGAAKPLDEDEYALQAVSPGRVYPINVLNLARVEGVGEIGLFRYSIHTLLNASKSHQKTSAKSEKNAGTDLVPCYPVVMFRSELAVHHALIREIFSQ
jgi:hypothetical protein